MFKYWIGKLALMGASGLLACFLWADDPGQTPGKADTQTVTGTVQSFTKAPVGEVDGAILSDGAIIHWPPHLGDRFTAIIAKGDRVKATGQMETGQAGEKHLEVLSLANLRTNASASNDDVAPPPPPGFKGKEGPKGPKGPGGIAPSPPPPVSGPVKTVQGTVRSFTKSPMGEKDGAVLDDGTAIHWPPHLGSRFTDILAKGDWVKVAGRMETGPEGDTHLEIQTLTNLRTNETVANDGPPASPTPSAERISARGKGGLEERVSELENQLDQLRREIQRLKRQP
ncbi:MAG TPA: bZIP transcription factor [Gemmataceae bacterium]|jgi:hypothetical protein|nr:bZIP transcription factor [Gemmataceae bacterium]